MTVPELPADVAGFVRAALGEVVITADHSWQHGEAKVWEAVAADGLRYAIKNYLRPAKFARELHAYRCWVPSLGAQAPPLLAASEGALTTILGWLPGQPLDQLSRLADAERQAYRQAGRLLATFHAAEASAPLDVAAQLRDRLDHWAPRADGVVAPGLSGSLRARIDELSSLPEIRTVSCHLDYVPRNWLVGEQGTVQVIDFERSRLSAWVEDLVKLAAREWQGRPDLRAAFLSGYGRRPTSAELAALDAYRAVGAMTTVVWAREHRDTGLELVGWDELRRLGVTPASARAESRRRSGG